MEKNSGEDTGSTEKHTMSELKEKKEIIVILVILVKLKMLIFCSFYKKMLQLNLKLIGGISNNLKSFERNTGRANSSNLLIYDGRPYSSCRSSGWKRGSFLGWVKCHFSAHQQPHKYSLNYWGLDGSRSGHHRYATLNPCCVGALNIRCTSDYAASKNTRKKKAKEYSKINQRQEGLHRTRSVELTYWPGEKGTLHESLENQESARKMVNEWCKVDDRKLSVAQHVFRLALKPSGEV